MKFSHVLDPCKPSASKLFLSSLLLSSSASAAIFADRDVPFGRLIGMLIVWPSFVTATSYLAGLPLAREVYSHSCPPHIVINMIASHTKHSFVLLHVVIHSVGVNNCYTVQKILRIEKFSHEKFFVRCEV